jgi:arsenate reductase
MTHHVLFLCVHNAGRSQMAAGFLRALDIPDVVVWSGGSAPRESVNQTAVAVMSELGIDIAGQVPRRWTDDDIVAADVIVTMGCGDSCPVVKGKRYEDWVLEDPADQSTEVVRRIRDEIKERVEALAKSLTR